MNSGVLIKNNNNNRHNNNLCHLKPFILESTFNEEVCVIPMNGESYSNDVYNFNGREKELCSISLQTWRSMVCFMKIEKCN